MQAQADVSNVDAIGVEMPVHDTQKADFELPRWKANFWFIVLTLIYLLDYADRFILAMVLPAIKKEYLLNDASIGMIGAILYIPIFLFALPCGILVDRWSRKYLIFIMVSIWSAATWLTGKATSYTQLLTARFFVGRKGAGQTGWHLQSGPDGQRYRGIRCRRIHRPLLGLAVCFRRLCHPVTPGLFNHGPNRLDGVLYRPNLEFKYGPGREGHDDPGRPVLPGALVRRLAQ
jgi:hypothetical protein